MSFKSFQSINDWVRQHYFPARLERLWQFLGQLRMNVTAVTSVAENYGSTYSTVEQTSYDSEGTATDITSEQRQTVPESTIAKTIQQLNSLQSTADALSATIARDFTFDVTETPELTVLYNKVLTSYQDKISGFSCSVSNGVLTVSVGYNPNASRWLPVYSFEQNAAFGAIPVCSILINGTWYKVIVILPCKSSRHGKLCIAATLSRAYIFDDMNFANAMHTATWNVNIDQIPSLATMEFYNAWNAAGDGIVSSYGGFKTIGEDSGATRDSMAMTLSLDPLSDSSLTGTIQVDEVNITQDADIMDLDLNPLIQDLESL